MDKPLTTMTIKGSPTYSLTTRSPEETRAFGRRLGRILHTGDVVCLSGALGAGKTHLTQGLAAGWGARETVTSPTFTLVNEYTRQTDDQRFFHLDGYRLSGATEAQTTGIDDIFNSPGVVVIEWAERIEDALPVNCLWIRILREEESIRRFDLHPSGQRARELTAELETE